VSAGLLLAGALAGCMTVHIEGKDGDVRTVRHAGLLQVQLASPQQAIVGSISGVGLVGAPLGWSLGYTRQRWAAIGPECRAVAWLEAGELNEGSRDALTRVAGLCLIAAPGTELKSGDVGRRASVAMENIR
jgi:hypothetical protein